MNNQSLRAAALIFFFAAAATVNAFAQEGIRGEEDACQKRQEAFMKELIQASLDYWSPKMTAYQIMIDKTLSKEDLQDLNQLRGRFLLTIRTMKDAQVRLAQRYKAEREASMRGMSKLGSDGYEHPYSEVDVDNGAVRDSGLPDSVMMAPHDSAAAAAAYAAIDSATLAGEARPDTPPKVVSVEMEVVADTLGASPDATAPSYERGESDNSDDDEYYGESADPDAQVMAESSREMKSMNTTTMKLAERYESRLQDLDGRMKSDMMEFLLVLAERMHKFGASNDMSICWSGNMMMNQAVSMETDSIRRNAADDFFKKIGPTQANAIVMLVGNDLVNVIQAAMQGERGDFSGLLPHKESAAPSSSATLEQNAPNPASISTEIAYMLPEPSSATVITLYGTDGKVAAAYDQGARPAGRQVVKIDVGALTPGTYVYRLKISTSAGDRVFSRTMQVVR
ncbi:MAG: Fibronectin type protein [Chlorobi bacterium]|nr:Fibronectin type protein [Chlorobiota bacterium]